MPTVMTAAVLYGREDVRIEQVPIPTVGPGEVRVRIDTALTCGTDVKVYRRGYHARMIQPPAVFGHEFAGTIDAVGQGVKGWHVGMRVSAANSAPCGDCSYCRRSQWELCEDLLFLNGAYAEFITIPCRIVENNLYAVPDNLPLRHAALAEPLACVLHGMESLTIAPGETVAVLGLGPIGLMFVRMCVLAGARVLAAGRRAERLSLAGALGAEHMVDVDAETDVLDAVRALTEGSRGPEIVIEAVGAVEAWEQAISLVRNSGVVCLFGGCPEGTHASVDTHRIHYDQVTLKGAFHHTPRTFRAALELLESGDMMAEKFILRTGNLQELPGVLAAFAAGQSRAVKIAIVPGS